MSIRKRAHRGYEVAWREDGRQRSRTFFLKSDAVAFESDIKRRRAFGRSVLLADYASHPEPVLADVALDAERPPRARRHLVEQPVIVRRGITYAISTKPYDGWVKVGRSASRPAARLDDLQTGNPVPLVFRAVWPFDVEVVLHEAYHRFRGRGEWFALPLEMVRDMGRLGRKPDPHRLLLESWPPRRIWDVAGGLDRRTAASLARCFAEPL